MKIDNTIESYISDRINEVNAEPLTRLDALMDEEKQKAKDVIESAINSACFSIAWDLGFDSSRITKNTDYYYINQIFRLDGKKPITTVRYDELAEIKNAYDDACNKLRMAAKVELSINKKISSVTDIDVMLGERAKAIGAKLSADLDKLLAEPEYGESD